MTNAVTFYPGLGADEAIAELHGLVGEIAAFWAHVEDGLFELFVTAIAGTWLVGDVRPYRAVFFTFSSYESKMRMVQNAMRARFCENGEITREWLELRKSLNGASELRNEIAHLVPMAKGSLDQNARANVRLVPPFWKAIHQERDFDELGYSHSQLLQALAPFWGFDPRINRFDVPDQTLRYRLRQFALKLEPPRSPTSPNLSGA